MTAKQFVRQYVKKDVLKAIQIVGKKIGWKSLKRDLLNGIIPFVSIAMSWISNMVATRKLARQALDKFERWSDEQRYAEE